MPSVRELVKGYQHEVQHANDLQPDRAAQILMELTALSGNVAEEIRAADAAYNQVLLTFLESEEKANRARIKAQTSGEYQRAREARDVQELVKAITASLKYFIRVKTEEMRMCGGQA